MAESKVNWQFTSNYTDLPERFYTYMTLNPVPEPKLIVINEQLAEELGLEADALKEEVAVLAGNKVPTDATPIAQAYMGHQFGHLTMLGDGRAILLGEHMTPKGKTVDIQLKGAGRTPYSRGGDGRAALGPMLREYIISEAMHHLGIPTTRALAVVATGEGVIREEILPGAILTRVAASHLRVGTFQYAYQFGTDVDLSALVTHALQTHFPELKEAANPALTLLKQMIRRQASLIADWQLIGFVHGVMNTDNMTISGETIDYGPCAFLDTYQPEAVFSSIDRHGRYAYANQPAIAEWNLARFAETLLPLLHDDEDEAVQLATTTLQTFRGEYVAQWLSGMRAKLGMDGEEAADEQLVNKLLALMEKHKADYTNIFLALTTQTFSSEALFEAEAFQNWLVKWKTRVRFDERMKDLLAQMKQHNPAIIPRNYYVEEALHAATEHGDFTKVYALIEATKNPYAHTANQKKYENPPQFDAPYETFCGT